MAALHPRHTLGSWWPCTPSIHWAHGGPTPPTYTGLMVVLHPLHTLGSWRPCTHSIHWAHCGPAPPPYTGLMVALHPLHTLGSWWPCTPSLICYLSLSLIQIFSKMKIFYGRLRTVCIKANIISLFTFLQGFFLNRIWDRVIYKAVHFINKSF